VNDDKGEFIELRNTTGDRNGEGTADVEDFFNGLVSKLGSMIGGLDYDQRFDFNDDGKVSCGDYFRFYRRFA